MVIADRNLFFLKAGLNGWEHDPVLFFRPSRNIPPLEEIYQRERRVQHLLNRVRRGQDPRALDLSTGRNR